MASPRAVTVRFTNHSASSRGGGASRAPGHRFAGSSRTPTAARGHTRLHVAVGQRGAATNSTSSNVTSTAALRPRHLEPGPRQAAGPPLPPRPCRRWGPRRGSGGRRRRQRPAGPRQHRPTTARRRAMPVCPAPLPGSDASVPERPLEQTPAAEPEASVGDIAPAAPVAPTRQRSSLWSPLLAAPEAPVMTAAPRAAAHTAAHSAAQQAGAAAAAQRTAPRGPAAATGSVDDDGMRRACGTGCRPAVMGRRRRPRR